MARACITNYNNRGLVLLTKLKSEGRIIDYWSIMGTPQLCFEFTKTLTITFDDYLDVASSYMQRDTHTKLLLQEFKDGVVLPIINSIQGGEVTAFSDTSIEIVDTSKNATICARVPLAVREALEKEAKEKGVTLSDIVRERLLSAAQS